MFGATYSFGDIKVHQTVIDELEVWLARKNRKVKKFTEPVINETIRLAKLHSSGLVGMTPAEREKSYNYLSAKEAKLDSSVMGAATSDTDKELLGSAYKNQAVLATQEKTMRAIAKQTLGPDRVKYFEDLVIDLIKSNQLSLEDVKTGIESLDRMNESLERGRQAEVLAEAAKKVV